MISASPDRPPATAISPHGSSPSPSAGTPHSAPAAMAPTASPANSPTAPPEATREPLSRRLQSVQVGTRQELELTRHIFRGEAAYVVHDPLTFRAHQLTVREYQVFLSLNSERSLGEIFAYLVDRKVLAVGQEEDFYAFVLKLNQLGLLNLSVSDGKSLFIRYQQKQDARLRGRLRSLLFQRIPLYNPDRLLNRTRQLVAPLFTRTAFVLWTCMMLSGLVIVGWRWESFRSPLGEMLALQNVPILWTLLVGLKVIHEFGHAYACKHFGGKVPEMGAYVILFTPCAYVDANAAWSFTSRRQRIIVSLAGMYFESMVAWLALVVWCLTENSYLHSIAQYAVVLSTVTTIGFNINPLMRYDGYFVLCDLVNIPNLRQLALSELLTALKHVGWGLPLESEVASRWKRTCLQILGAAVAIYQGMVMVGISALLAFKLPIVGVYLAVLFLGQALGSLLRRLISYACLAQETAPVRRRAVLVTCGGLTLVVGGLFLIPLPSSISAVGALRRTADQVVRAVESGFFTPSPIAQQSAVVAGDILGHLTSETLAARQAQLQARIAQLRIQYRTELVGNPTVAAATQRELLQAEQDWQALTDRLQNLTVAIPRDGALVPRAELKTTGRYVHAGEPLAWVSSGTWVLQAWVTEESISDWRPQAGDQVEVRLANETGHQLTGHVVQIDQAARQQLDDPGLSQLAGGTILVKNEQLEIAQPYYAITVALDDPDPRLLRHGLTAHLTFRGPRRPWGLQLVRRALQFRQNLRLNE